MKIRLLMHDCHLEIGHSHAMIETLRNLPEGRVSELEVVSYTSSDLKVLFPGIKAKHVKVPLKNLYPALLRLSFYAAWVQGYLKLKGNDGFFNISIGTASPDADLVNVQFCQAQWVDQFFKTRDMHGIKALYKKALFRYHIQCENWLYKKKSVKFMVLSHFVLDFMKEHFGLRGDQARVIYSGINLDRFKPVSRTREDLARELKEIHPELEGLDPKEPIFLFVGAYERKGLRRVLEALAQAKSPRQLVVIGKPESVGEFQFPDQVKVFPVRFTTKLVDFYSLCDSFVFPSLYEPFGLVVIEAAAMGMRVFVTKKSVGASELLENLPGLDFWEETEKKLILESPILSSEERASLREQRLERLRGYTWAQAGLSFDRLLSEWKT